MRNPTSPTWLFLIFSHSTSCAIFVVQADIRSFGRELGNALSVVCTTKYINETKKVHKGKACNVTKTCARFLYFFKVLSKMLNVIVRLLRLIRLTCGLTMHAHCDYDVSGGRKQ